MDISQRGIDFVAAHEGFSSTAYQDQGGVWTIGYGRTQGVKQHDVTTREAARLWLSMDLSTAAEAVRRDATAFLNQNQFDALCSLVYNIGGGAFKTAHSILDPLIAGDYDKAADGFLNWCNINHKPNQGLLNRRRDERALFLEPVE